MKSITGELEAGEAQAAISAVAARQRGSVFGFYVAMFALMSAGAALGYAIGRMLQTLTTSPLVDPWLTGCVGLWGGWLAYVRLCRPLIVRRFRNNMSARGLETRFRQTVTLTDEALVLESGGVRSVADWSAVTELFRVRGYWIFLVQMEPWFAPRHFFSSPSDEKAFVGVALSHLPKDALVRSRDAVNFAAPQPFRAA